MSPNQPPPRRVVTMLLLLSLPLLAKTMSISKLSITSVELTQQQELTEDDPTFDPVIEDDQNDDQPETPVEVDSPIVFDSPVSNEVEETPNVLDTHVEITDNNNDLTFSFQVPQKESDLTSTSSSNRINVFEVYNAENNISMVGWNCKIEGESQSMSEGCITAKDNLVENVIQPTKPLFQTMIASVESDEDAGTMRLVLVGTARDSIVDEINARILKRAETQVGNGDNVQKTRLVKNATIVAVLTVNMEESAEEEKGTWSHEEGGDEKDVLGHEEGSDEEVIVLGQGENDQDQGEEGGNLRPEVESGEEDNHGQEEDGEGQNLGHDAEGEEGGDLRGQEGDEKEDDLGVHVEYLQEEEGGKLRQVEVETLPLWTAEELVDMDKWCNVCVHLSKRFRIGSLQKYTFLMDCANNLSIRSFDAAVCDNPLHKERDQELTIVPIV